MTHAVKKPGNQEAAAEAIEKRAAAEIAFIEKERDEQLSILDKLIERVKGIAVAAREALERKADRLLNFMARVDAFDRTFDADIARDKEAKILQASRKPREPDREDMDRQLRDIARSKARLHRGERRGSFPKTQRRVGAA